MDKSPDARGQRRSGGGGKTNLASCVVATVFLILVTGVLVVVYLIFFRPRDPKIEVDAIQFPSFYSTNGTVSFTFAQYATVHNPNRAAFSHYDSTLQLVYAGNQVGFMFIPAAQIDGGRTQYMAASFAVDFFPLPAPPPPGGSMEVESRMRLNGRVRVLRFFTHHVEATTGCLVVVSAGNGAVLGFRC